MPDLAHSIKMEKEVFRVFRSKEAVAWGRALNLQCPQLGVSIRDL